MQKKIFIAKDIVKQFGNYTALNHVNLEIPEKSIFGLLGPNGAGKTTLMRIIKQIIAPDSGSLIFNGNKLKREDIAKIGYLPEHNPLYPNMFVKEYLSFVGVIYKIDNLKNRITEIIEQTGLSTEQTKKIGELSKGFKQRVGLAAALIHNPKILILDEPTTGLDPNQLVEIRNLIKEVGRDKTVLLSTHIMQEVDKMCNRVIIINRGKIVDDKQIADLQKKGLDLENHFRNLTI